MLNLELMSKAHIDVMIMIRPQKNWAGWRMDLCVVLSWGSLAMSSEGHDP